MSHEHDERPLVPTESWERLRQERDFLRTEIAAKVRLVAELDAGNRKLVEDVEALKGELEEACDDRDRWVSRMKFLERKLEQVRRLVR